MIVCYIRKERARTIFAIHVGILGGEVLRIHGRMVLLVSSKEKKVPINCNSLIKMDKYGFAFVNTNILYEPSVLVSQVGHVLYLEYPLEND